MNQRKVTVKTTTTQLYTIFQRMEYNVSYVVFISNKILHIRKTVHRNRYVYKNKNKYFVKVCRMGNQSKWDKEKIYVRKNLFDGFHIYLYYC